MDNDVSRAAPYWSLPPEEVLHNLGSGAQGLSGGEAAARLARCGPNRLSGARRGPALHHHLRQIASPLG
ncbi:MAG TPA: hypothetical protein DD490_32315, partial [Acidobacteria bacterium]|nr:hypothetical protein [Acidobacteriota bacterium]